MAMHKKILAVLFAFFLFATVTLVSSFFSPAEAYAAASANAEQIKLPEPVTQGGMPLMQALSLRKSTRSFSKEELSMQQVSNILWTAFGQNRPDGRRTVPTARNLLNMVVYVALPSGVWRYLPESNELVKESGENLCDALGGAPCTLGFAVEGKFGGMHAGSAYQNVGLYCASEGLANVVKATGVDVMKKYIKPAAGYELVIIHSIGKP
jgi:Nitroreductase family.